MSRKPASLVPEAVAEDRGLSTEKQGAVSLRPSRHHIVIGEEVVEATGRMPKEIDAGSRAVAVQSALAPLTYACQFAIMVNS